MAFPNITDPVSEWPYEAFPETATERPVTERFRTIATRFAESIAVTDSVRALTYRELARLVELTKAAISATAGEAPVAVFLPNEARYAAAMLASMELGRGYLALDANHPPERNRRIARHVEASAVVTSKSSSADARELFDGIPVIDLDNLPTTVKLEAVREPSADDVAWILCTSGSTGAPKGVYQSQRGLLHDIMRSTNMLHLSSRDRQLLHVSPSLFAGTRTAFGTLLNGGSMHCASPQELRASDFGQSLTRLGITVIRTVPALFRHAVETAGPRGKLESLRLVYLGGDRVDWRDYDLFCQVCTDTAVFGIHLGSTESSGAFIQCLLPKGVQPSDGRMPIGLATPAYDVVLAQEDGQPVHDGEAGEFVISSQYLSLGYWKDPSSPKFGVSADTGKRSFRTGDLGLRRSDGLFEYRGRIDDQVKIAGQRVEPAELEHALASCQGVASAASVVRRNASGDAIAIVAYVEVEPGVRGLLPRHLRTALERHLPPHLLPAAIHLLPSFPRLPSLKIDRQALRRIDDERSRLNDDRASNATIEAVAGLVEEILESKGATADDSLVSLGGNSFQAVRLWLALEERFGVRIPEEIMNAAPTIREMAEWMATAPLPSSA